MCQWGILLFKFFIGSKQLHKIMLMEKWNLLWKLKNTLKSCFASALFIMCLGLKHALMDYSVSHHLRSNQTPDRSQCEKVYQFANQRLDVFHWARKVRPSWWWNTMKTFQMPCEDYFTYQVPVQWWS